MFTQDLDIIDPSTVENNGPQYPVAQWLHGDPKLAAAGGVAHTGGLILPAKYVPDDIAPPPGWSRTTVAFSSGKSEVDLACAKPRLAVVRTRFRWFTVQGGAYHYFPRSQYAPDMGQRGHLQALCGVYGFDTPVVVTFKGKASQEFERLLREFGQKTAEAVLRVTKKDKVPRFAFYMRLSPGPHVKVGKKGQESIITPPVLELPQTITEDYLTKTYVGRERLIELQALYHSAAEWSAAWDRAGADAESDDYAEQPPEDDVLPQPEQEVFELSPADAAAALKKAGISKAQFEAALVEHNGRPTYSPSRDTALVHALIGAKLQGKEPF